MIIVDEGRFYENSVGGYRRRYWHHLGSDANLEELLAFGRRIGLNRSWFQAGRVPHYDVTRPRVQKAIGAGAVQVSNREFVRRMRTRWGELGAC